MNNELIKKAYKLFDGVWPYRDNCNMVATDKYGAVEFYYTTTPFDAFSNDSGLWHWVGTKADFDAYGESLKEEWMPDVGQECEYPSGSGVVRLPPDINGVLIVEEGEEGYKRVHKSNCRPIKSDKEKRADEMFDIVKDATDTYHACELLVQNGYKKC
jgi:hypothetical protein